MKNIQIRIVTLAIIIGFFSGCKTTIKTTPVVFNQLLREGWSIASAADINVSGDLISRSGFDVSKWYKTTVPSTVMAALIANNEYPDIFMGENINKVDTARFRTSWWYRNEFNVDDEAKNTELVFEGINYRANIWLNGVKIASADTLFGGFRIFKINISKDVTRGRNALAAEIFHQNEDEPSIGFVDWAPMAPDREMGLWRPVKIITSGKASLNNAFVLTKIDKKEFREADLQVSVETTNNTSGELKVVVKGAIENISFEKKVILKPNEKQLVVFNSSEYPQLKISNPRIWWTYEMGKPELYNLALDIESGNEVSYSMTTRFGIREVEDYINELGHRGYMLNGVKLLIKGGGWVDGLFLNDSEEKVKAQMEYAIHANMNTIRLEGFWGNSERFYELADELGLLLMAGWSCQWEWNSYLSKPEDDFMSLKTPGDIKLIVNYTRDHVYWLRNHPSIFVWVMGSDKLPRPELETKYDSLFKLIDPSRPVLKACKEQTSIISGKTAIKMRGPYEYVSPNYWYIDTLNGGAFGFNSETGPGTQVPSIEVLKSMIPEEKLWPVNDIWNFHCGRNEFQTIERYVTAFNNRYGKQSNPVDFTFKSQASNLEAMRAMFEAFAINRSKTTGIIQWMYNSAWPKLIWQLWDYNLMPNGAFYGARIGARQVNIAYNYGDNSVYITNLKTAALSNLSAEIKIYNLDGTLIEEKKVNAQVKSDGSEKIYSLPEGKPYSNVYFLCLKLNDNQGNIIAGNFYWLSRKNDVPDFKNTEWFYTPLSEYADFTDLNELPVIKINVEDSILNKNNEYEINVKLYNPNNKIAFLIELNVVGDKSGKSVVPILWDDNYVSLTPMESKVVTGRFSFSALKGEKPVFRYKGWNIK
ncbi:MAG: glycoside hydrolase family 2 TIM barrel-domain containing protein [Bacteroidota bacterium]